MLWPVVFVFVSRDDFVMWKGSAWRGFRLCGVSWQMVNINLRCPLSRFVDRWLNSVVWSLSVLICIGTQMREAFDDFCYIWKLVCDTFLYEVITDVCFKKHHLVWRPFYVVLLSVAMSPVSEVWDDLLLLFDFVWKRYTSQAADYSNGVLACLLLACFKRESLYRPGLSTKPSGLMRHSVNLMLCFVVWAEFKKNQCGVVWWMDLVLTSLYVKIEKNTHKTFFHAAFALGLSRPWVVVVVVDSSYSTHVNVSFHF